MDKESNKGGRKRDLSWTAELGERILMLQDERSRKPGRLLVCSCGLAERRVVPFEGCKNHF